MRKRALSLLLTLVFCLTMLPTAALAEETDTQTGTGDTVYTVNADTAVQSTEDGAADTVGNAVAEVTIGDQTTPYDTLANAFAAAQENSGSTVKLLSDVTTDTPIVVSSGTLTIDLNGKKWDRASGHTLWVQGGNVTVTSTQGTGTISNGTNNAICAENKAENNAVLHVTKGVRLTRLCAMQGVSLTLDAGVIITKRIWTDNKEENIAQFLSGKALQRCDENGNASNEYVSLYNSYRETDTGCVIVIEHASCTGTTETPCPICGGDGTQSKPTEPEDPNVAEVNGTKYESFSEAINAAKSDGTVKLLKNVWENITITDGTSVTIDLNEKTWCGMISDEVSHPVPLTVNGGSVTVKNGTLAQGSGGAASNTAMIINGGSLTVGESMTIAGSTITSESYYPAIDVQGGELSLSEGTKLVYGMRVPEGKQLKDYLPEGTAFAKDDGSVIDGYVQEHVNGDTLTVVPHTHSADYTRKCACGYTCNGHSWNNGVCTKCGYVCPHDSFLTDWDGTVKCSFCNTQMAVKVEKDGTTTYYAKHSEDNEYHAEDTLRQVFNEADSGSTVTLLADGLYASGWVTNKNITLNLNGKKLVENNGLVVAKEENGNGKGYLTVTGEGSSEALAGSSYPCTFRVCDDGELRFDEKFSGSYGTIYVEGGTLSSDSTDMTFDALEIQNSGATVQLEGGNFGKITCSGSKTLGDLLLKNYGRAFKNTNGTFLKYSTEITNTDAVANVSIAVCPHDSVTNSTCNYCGTEHIVVVYYATSGGSPTTFVAESDDADAIDRVVNDVLGKYMNHASGTVKLFADAALQDLTIDTSSNSGSDYHNELTIDLNGHTLTGGTLTANDLVTLTITDSSENKGSYSASVTVNGGASLIVDGVPVDEICASEKTDDGKSPSITLKPGAKFKSLNLYYGSKYSGLALADCLEPGSYLVDDEGAAVSDQLDYTYTGSINPWTVKQIDGTVTADEKIGNIPYNSTVPESLNPSVTMADGSTPSLTYTWYYRTDIGTAELPSEAPNVGETLDAFCIITAKDSNRNTLWETAVTGYTLTVTKGQAEVTKAPAAIENLTYNGETQELITAGEASDGEMQYSTEQNGAYSTTIPTGTDAKKYTVWYKVVGDSNHEDTTPESVSVTIAPKKVALTGGVTAENRTYEANNTAVALNKNTLTFDGLVGEETLDATLSGGTVETADAGENKPVTYTATLTDGTNGGKASNYVLTEKPSVTVKITKADAAFTTPTAKTLTYNGGEQALVDAGTTADGTMLYSLSETGEYSDTVPTGKNADTYTVWYKVAGDSNHNDSAAESVSVTIAKTKVIVTAADKSAYVGSTAPDLSKPEQGRDYTVSGLFGEDKLPAAPTLRYVDETGKEIKPDMTKVGEVLIRADGEQSDNYVIVYVAGKLTVTTRPSSGGGGSSSTKTETTTNPDGSTTKTETKSDGTVTSTTTNKDGSTTKTETKKDGSSTTEVKDASGSTGTVSTDKSGKTSASATISEKAVSDAKKSDEAVKVPTTEIKAGESSASAPTVKIDLPKNAGETKVEIPVKDVTSGTVAIIVKPDGTEEIVKDSLPTENGLELTVNGDVTVKIVDNAKNFADTEGHWAQDAIDFVSARGLVNGTSDSSFSPEAPTTRAQLWTMLARQADADTTGGATWYEKAQTWAKNSGISDGTNPNGTITRAEMVTMLWRAAGSPVVNYAMNMADVPADSWYTEAVRWALSTGITTGTGSSKFDPNSTCTRAQIATFLYRTYQAK